MGVVGAYVLIVSCDRKPCAAKSNLVCKGGEWVCSDEVRANSYSQARMRMIRAGWKIRKDKALCPDCIRQGARMRDLQQRKRNG